MRNYNIFKFTNDSDQTLIYIPVLNKAFILPNAKAAQISNTISPDGDQSIMENELSFPPSFERLEFDLSSRCNLRCLYCYSESNEFAMSLSKSQIKTAIDYYLEHLSTNVANIGFMGGGEPTVEWSIFKYAVDYAIEQSSCNKKELHLSIVSNGMWNDRQLSYISKHFHDITLSFDGYTEIQNTQRPTLMGTGSFNHVYRIAKELHSNKKIELEITPLINSETVHRLTDIVRFFCDEYSGTTIRLSILREVGARARSSNLGTPDITTFFDNTLEAIKTIRRLGYTNNIINPFINFTPESFPYFCGACGRNCIITSSGLITACGSILARNNENSDFFIFGNISNNDINFDEKKYGRLAKSLNALQIDKCNKCFALYACRGGCPSLKADLKNFWNRPSLYCKEIKEAVVKYLWYLCEKDEDLDEQK